MSIEQPSVPQQETGDMVQVIDGGGEFRNKDEGDSTSVARFLSRRKDFLGRGLDYSVVAVLGAQSSGKSTLLNILFDMRFQVLSAALGRERTTHGVWLGVAPRAPGGETGGLVVLDVEGTDGSCRQDELSFERKTSLFSLAVSSVLIVNIWYQDIGRYNAANLALLKTVFDIHLQLFESSEKPQPQANKTLILFVIRDHIMTPLEKLEELLRRSMAGIWESLAKPKTIDPSRPITDFFDFAFEALPHMVLEPKAFDAGVDRLRQRFLDPAISSGWLLSPTHRRDIPADGFATFAEKIWEVIKANKDLDLPSQKHMLATYRCEEIADECYKGFAAEVDAGLAEPIERRGAMVEAFGEKADAVYGKWFETYSTPASRYLAEVAEHKGQDLAHRMQQELARLFRLLLGLAAARALGKLDTRLAALIADIVSEKAQEKEKEGKERIGVILEEAAAEALRDFEKVAREGVMNGATWPFDAELAKHKAAVVEKVAAARSQAIAHVVKRIKGEAREKLEVELLPILDKVSFLFFATS